MTVETSLRTPFITKTDTAKNDEEHTPHPKTKNSHSSMHELIVPPQNRQNEQFTTVSRSVEEICKYDEISSVSEAIEFFTAKILFRRTRGKTDEKIKTDCKSIYNYACENGKECKALELLVKLAVDRSILSFEDTLTLSCDLLPKLATISAEKFTKIRPFLDRLIIFLLVSHLDSSNDLKSLNITHSDSNSSVMSSCTANIDVIFKEYFSLYARYCPDSLFASLDALNDSELLPFQANNQTKERYQEYIKQLRNIAFKIAIPIILETDVQKKYDVNKKFKLCYKLCTKASQLGINLKEPAIWSAIASSRNIEKTEALCPEFDQLILLFLDTFKLISEDGNPLDDEFKKALFEFLPWMCRTNALINKCLEKDRNLLHNLIFFVRYNSIDEISLEKIYNATKKILEIKTLDERETWSEILVFCHRNWELLFYEMFAEVQCDFLKNGDKVIQFFCNYFNKLENPLHQSSVVQALAKCVIKWFDINVEGAIKISIGVIKYFINENDNKHIFYFMQTLFKAIESAVDPKLLHQNLKPLIEHCVLSPIDKQVQQEILAEYSVMELLGTFKDINAYSDALDNKAGAAVNVCVNTLTKINRSLIRYVRIKNLYSKLYSKFYSYFKTYLKVPKYTFEKINLYPNFNMLPLEKRACTRLLTSSVELLSLVINSLPETEGGGKFEKRRNFLFSIADFWLTQFKFYYPTDDMQFSVNYEMYLNSYKTIIQVVKKNLNRKINLEKEKNSISKSLIQIVDITFLLIDKEMTDFLGFSDVLDETLNCMIEFKDFYPKDKDFVYKVIFLKMQTQKILTDEQANERAEKALVYLKEVSKESGFKNLTPSRRSILQKRALVFFDAYPSMRQQASSLFKKR